MIDRAEAIVHDDYAGREYWRVSDKYFSLKYKLEIDRILFKV
jgi:hypothetical protein